MIAKPREKKDGSSLPMPLTVTPLVAVSASSSVNRFCASIWSRSMTVTVLGVSLSGVTVLPTSRP